MLDAIARSLELSTEALYAEAGEDPAAEPEEQPVVEAIRADKELTGRQRQALIEVYEAFAASNGARRSRRR